MIWIILLAAQANFDAEISVCQRRSEERPLTLCLSETEFDRSNVRLNKQWRETLRHVQATRGAATAAKLRAEQRQWIIKRDHQCSAYAAPTPSTQQGVNWVQCASGKTDDRSAQLRAMMGK